tara:strand:- start:3594 stop:3764 length:171 start_codon:yes stop_codon:yes gene_type:complete
MILEDSYLISNFSSILWVFYPIGCLILIELVLRAIDGDDDDDQSGGIMTPIFQKAK